MRYRSCPSAVLSSACRAPASDQGLVSVPSSRSRNQKPSCAWKNTSPNGEVNRGCLPWISAQSPRIPAPGRTVRRRRIGSAPCRLSGQRSWNRTFTASERTGSGVSWRWVQPERLAFLAAGQLLRCAARADLGLQRGELAVHVRVGPGLVQFLLDVVGATADDIQQELDEAGT